MAQRKKPLTPLEIASQLREASKNPMDPSLRKLIKKAADLLISLSAPPPELEPEDEPPLPSMSERAKDAE